MLVSRDVALTEKRINEFPTDWSKLHVIINTTDKDVEKDLIELVEDCELEYTVTESDGTPATGKNSLLKVFLESDNDYAVGIDGDDYITDYGAQFYNNLAEHPNPPDLLALYNQLAQLPNGGWTYFQDRTDTNNWTYEQFMEYFNFNDDGTPEDRHQWALEKLDNHKWLDMYGDKDENMLRMVWFSRKAAEQTYYDNTIVLGEDVLQYLKHKYTALVKKDLRMYVLKDGNGVDLGHEPTYVSYLGEISISRPQVNRQHWDWLAPYNAKIKELIERNEITPPHVRLPEWKNTLDKT